MPKLEDVKLGLMERVEMVKIGRKVQHIRNKNEKEKQPMHAEKKKGSENWYGFPPRRLMLMEEEEMGVLISCSSIGIVISRTNNLLIPL